MNSLSLHLLEREKNARLMHQEADCHRDDRQEALLAKTSSCQKIKKKNR